MSNETANTKKCRYCGKEISSETPFCWYCGRELETRPERPAETSKGGAPLWLYLAALALVVIVIAALVAGNIL